eukprot:UN25275
MVAGIGNLLEWYDFSVFGLLVDPIGKNFFPPEDKTSVFLKGFSVFAGAFVMRPIGGVLFGYIGDKYGRLKALRISILMMAIPTAIMGIIPTYQTIGISSTVCLVIIRLFQGLSVGGEWAGAMIFTYETAPPKHRNLFAGVLQASSSGALVGSFVVWSCRQITTEEQMNDWGWRMPFAFGLLLTIFGCFFDRVFMKSGEMKESLENNEILKNPIYTALNENKNKYCTYFGWFVSNGLLLSLGILPDYFTYV